MKLNYFRYIFCILVIYSTNGYGQTCDENLETARKYYNEGKLHLIYGILDPCITANQLNKDQLIEANRLLGNTSYNLDSTDRGLEYIENILNKNLSFQLSESDVFKFRSNLTKLRKSPNYQFGLSLGINRPTIILDDVYDAIFNRVNANAIYGLSEGNILTNFREHLGVHVSTVFVKRVFYNLHLETGFGFQSTGFSYTDHYGKVKKETMISDFQIPLLINYRLPLLLKEQTLFIQSGANVSWLQSWKHSDRLGEELKNNTTDIRSAFSYSLVVGTFMNWRLRNIVLRPNFQYWIGLTGRSKKITDSENAAYVYNSPSFVNYNARLNYYVLSISLLKQKF